MAWVGLGARSGLSRYQGNELMPGNNLRDELCGNAAPIAWPDQPAWGGRAVIDAKPA